MRFDFQFAVGEQTLRPIVEVAFPGIPQFSTYGLVDSGALRNRFSADIAEALGLDISQVKPEPVLAGGGRHLAYEFPVTMRVGAWEWAAPVSFIQGWDHPYGLLGLGGFFDTFNVHINGARLFTALNKHRRT